MSIPQTTIEVLHVTGQGAEKTRDRVRWIDTKTLEVLQSVRGPGSWRQIDMKPALAGMASRLNDCLGRRVHSPDWRQDHRVLSHQYISLVFRAFFRALPVEETLRVTIREALRRLPSDGGLRRIPVFKGEAEDAYGGEVGLDTSPIVTEADLVLLGLSNTNPGGNNGASEQAWSAFRDGPSHRVERCCRER
jgi:hypothetical protein